MIELQEILTYSFIFGFGILTSLEDIREGKIKNKYIIIALAFALIINFNNIFVGQSYFFATLINFAISFLVGVLLWHFHFWTAGDAKLFFSYGFLIPLSVYSYRYFYYFPSLELLINTYIVIMFAIVANLLIKTDAKEKVHILKSSFDKKNLIEMFFITFGFSWLLSVFLGIFGIELNFFIILIILIILRRVIEKSYIFKLSIIVSIARVFFDYSNIVTLSFLFNFSLGYLFFIIAIQFFQSLGSFIFTKPLKIKDLKPGMMPFELIVKTSGGYSKTITLPLKNNKKYTLLYRPNKLFDKKDIEIIKKLYRERKIKSDNIKIQQTLPFAPFLFIGFLLTVLFQGNVVGILKTYIYRF